MLIASAPALLGAVVRTDGRPQSTVRLMRDMIDRAKLDPSIISAAHSIVLLTPERQPLHEVNAIYEWVRDRIRYVGDVHGVETLSYPALVMRRKTGDCDDQTMLLCALLESIGYPTRLVIAQYAGNGFEHVYAQVFAGNQWLDCEPIERSGFVGYAYPDARQIWIEPR